MPAIRYYHQCTFAVVDHSPSSRWVEVRKRDGSFERLPWLGMICEHAAEILPGLGYAKIRAHEVTNGDGIAGCTWHKLTEGQYVLGWRSQLHEGTGVYGVVDRNLVPIIIGTHGRKGSPKLKLIA